MSCEDDDDDNRDDKIMIIMTTMMMIKMIKMIMRSWVDMSLSCEGQISTTSD